MVPDISLLYGDPYILSVQFAARDFREIGVMLFNPKHDNRLGLTTGASRHLERYARRSRAELLIANLTLAALVLLTVIGLGLIAPARMATSESAVPQACDLIRNGADRTGCHERQVDEESSAPARGAIAPPFAPVASPSAR